MFTYSEALTQTTASTSSTAQEPMSSSEGPLNSAVTHVNEDKKLLYFCDDIGIKLHRYHWNLVYPTDGPEIVVRKDRRGELFLYNQQQIIARYNFERLANNLKLLENEHWDNLLSGVHFPILGYLKRWRNRILEDIHKGAIKGENGENIALTEENGTDIIGNMIESSILSPNRKFYGDLYNLGCLGLVSAVDHMIKGVNDSFLYRWYVSVDNIAEEFKTTLPGYDFSKLNYPGVTICQVNVYSGGLSIQKNTFQTFWQESSIYVTHSFDSKNRSYREPIPVNVKYIHHNPFVYDITVNNDGQDDKRGTCRIFLVPKFDDKGKPWLFREQRRYFIEMDKFKVHLESGRNTIMRSCKESSVIIPHEHIYPDLDIMNSLDHYCICGWPENMLVPRGTIEGMQCELFVMISEYDNDKVEQSIEGKCIKGSSYCGIKNKLYPDRRAMGYPFDRLPWSDVETLQQFLTPNMMVTDVTIQFDDSINRQKYDLDSY